MKLILFALSQAFFFIQKIYFFLVRRFSYVVVFYKLSNQYQLEMLLYYE